jgi:multicomponent K+:H+ antiporter subunit D
MDLTTLAVLPVLVPLTGVIANLVLGDGRGRILGINIAFSIILLLVSAALLAGLLASGETAMAVYSFGNWPIPFGIVFVADRLAAVMVLTTSVLALAALLFATARWYRRGTAFFPLFHALTMGLNGAFLTGDLFNLFVFFELLLAASYGLVLHGSGRNRVRSALHYIAVNLVASSLFLIGVALIYGSTGTLNMADIARQSMSLEGDARTLFEVGASVLGIAFLIKAGAWPLHFWLPPAYSAAAPPVAALFTIMTKVGFYAVLRLKTLAFENSDFGELSMLVIGLATLAYGSIGALSSKALDRLASYLILVSAGTLLLAAAYDVPGVTAGALLYLIVATLAAGALFLLKDIIDQALPAEAQVLAISLEFYGEDDEEEIDEDQEVTPTVPTGAALISWCFAIVALVLAGLPPLAGFLSKFVMISSAFSSADTVAASTWWFAAAVIASGLLVLVAMVRNGINIFWTSMPETGIRVRLMEIVPVVLLLALCVIATILSGPIIDILASTAANLHDPDIYINGVLGLAEANP